MALKVDATGERATAPSAWAGGAVTIVGWIRRPATTTQGQFALLNAANGTTGAPRITLGTASGATLTSTYAGDSGASNNGSTATYAANTWFHAGVVARSSAPNTINQIATSINAVLDSFSAASARDLALTALIDTFMLGLVASSANADYAHVAIFNAELSQDQLTELQTKLPNAITGATPICYWSCIGGSGTANQGSGGSTYDLTLVGGATIDATNDGTLPALSGSGGASATVAVTDAGDTSGINGSTPVVATVAVTDAGDAPSINGVTPVVASVSVTDAGDASSVAGSAGPSTYDIRLTLGQKREQGAEFAGATGVEWWVFNHDRTVYASGTGMALDAEGRAIIDLDGTPFALGTRLKVALSIETAEADPIDRTIWSGLAYGIAEAQP